MESVTLVGEIFFVVSFPSPKTGNVQYSLNAKVHLMHLDPNIYSMELVFLSEWQHGYDLNYTLGLTGIVKCKF